MDWTIVTGAVLGSGLTLGGVWLTARQRERADLRAAALEQRAEWGRRLAMALGEVAQGADSERYAVGVTMLRRLATSELANSEDRELADILLQSVQSHQARSTAGARDLDESGTSANNENSDSTGGAR